MANCDNASATKFSGDVQDHYHVVCTVGKSNGTAYKRSPWVQRSFNDNKARWTLERCAQGWKKYLVPWRLVRLRKMEEKELGEVVKEVKRWFGI